MHPFRAALATGDMDAAVALLADDVVFRSPVVFKAFEGRETAGPILRAVGQVLQDVVFVRDLSSEDGTAHSLLFRARVGEKEIEGSNFFHVNEAGAIDELVVMVRPFTGTLALREAMITEFAAAGVTISA
ncbi:MULTISPECIES: nuclear transport factor 2 family protein [unclassified Streptomyces]|uniref:nuclear transport factor 2 family protein n=1 Tax=unclassified Streptomyces TaxID=2593676 RepID=UPI0037916037